MTTRLLPKVTLAALAAIGVFLPLGAGMAGAAPSSSSAAKLRECLRASADLHQTTFGGRYVTAEDVARCMEAFRPGSSGGVSKGGNASATLPTVADGNGATGLPQRFRMTFTVPSSASNYVSECQVRGNDVTCTETIEPPINDSFWTGKTTASLSGMTATGTKTANLTSPPNAGGCSADYRYSGPISLSFGTNRNVTMRWGPTQVDLSWGAACPGSRSETAPVVELNGSWSEVK